ncbi:uncharacterized protein [Leptinotarsa decemlineata]|uniref:uncharacterized protein n=1 Tax=Leptinotarsa decemlineata TaxID=7539 RepID=UPI003D30CD35
MDSMLNELKSIIISSKKEVAELKSTLGNKQFGNNITNFEVVVQEVSERQVRRKNLILLKVKNLESESSFSERQEQNKIKIALKNPLAGIQFGPVIEPYHNGAFFYNYSERGLSEGYFNHVPTIIGVNSNEGAATGSIPALIRLYSLKYDIQFKLLAPEDLTKYFLGRRIGYIKYM